MIERRFGVAVYKEKFNFCSAHFLLFADGGREQLHGHNYRVSVEVDGPIGPGDMVVDFMVLKPIVKAACDSLDHRMLLPADSQHLTIRYEGDMIWAEHENGRFAFPAGDCILLPIPNTSTERLAEYLCGIVRSELSQKLPELDVYRVRVSVEESSGQCGYYEERKRE